MSENTVEIPKEMADYIRGRYWFKHYIDLEELVMEAVRRLMDRKDILWGRWRRMKNE